MFNIDFTIYEMFWFKIIPLKRCCCLRSSLSFECYWYPWEQSWIRCPSRTHHQFGHFGPLESSLALITNAYIHWVSWNYLLILLFEQSSFLSCNKLSTYQDCSLKKLKCRVPRFYQSTVRVLKRKVSQTFVFLVMPREGARPAALALRNFYLSDLGLVSKSPEI